MEALAPVGAVTPPRTPPWGPASGVLLNIPGCSCTALSRCSPCLPGEPVVHSRAWARPPNHPGLWVYPEPGYCLPQGVLLKFNPHHSVLTGGQQMDTGIWRLGASRAGKAELQRE